MIAALLAAALSSPSPSPVETPTPQTILRRALDRLKTYQTPPFVVYTIEENGVLGRIAFRSSDETIEDVTQFQNDGTLPSANIYHAFVGPLSRSVHDTAVPVAAAPQTSPTPQSVDLGASLETIAATSVSAKPIYHAKLDGIVQERGHQVYRIELEPTGDLLAQPLRDLFIDTDTYDIISATYFALDPSVGTPASLAVFFSHVGNAWVTSDWYAIYPAPRYAVAEATPPPRHVVITMMTFPATLPDWLFSQKLYDEHRRAHDADPVAGLLASPRP